MLRKGLLLSTLVVLAMTFPTQYLGSSPDVKPAVPETTTSFEYEPEGTNNAEEEAPETIISDINAGTKATTNYREAITKAIANYEDEATKAIITYREAAIKAITNYEDAVTKAIANYMESTTETTNRHNQEAIDDNSASQEKDE